MKLIINNKNLSILQINEKLESEWSEYIKCKTKGLEIKTKELESKPKY